MLLAFPLHGAQSGRESWRQSSRLKELFCCAALILTRLEMAAGKWTGTQLSATLEAAPSSTTLADSPTPTGAFLATKLGALCNPCTSLMRLAC